MSSGCNGTERIPLSYDEANRLFPVKCKHGYDACPTCDTKPCPGCDDCPPPGCRTLCKAIRERVPDRPVDGLAFMEALLETEFVFDHGQVASDTITDWINDKGTERVIGVLWR